jgi:hypothetical protein
MKTSFLTAFAVAALCLGAAHAQNSASLLPSTGPGATNGQFVIKNINVSTPKTPEFQTQGGETQAKRYTLGAWLEVEVEFSATAPTPEVVFRYDFAINGKLLTGEQTVVDVQPGQSLFTIVYVAPRTISTLLKGQPLTVNTLQNARVQIQRPGVAAPLAVKFQKEGGANFFSTAQQIPGFVLNKAQTPFANLWWDRYETVRPAQTR